MAIKEYSLPGVKTYDLNVLPDERGFFCEAFRSNWTDIFNDEIVQSNISYSYPGIIRAWHRHLRGQVDYFMVLRGALKICAYDDREDQSTKGKLVEITASSQKLQIVRIPGIYWHGTKNVGNEPSLLMYFVNRLYDAKNPDEDRRPWNDLKVINPSSGEPFDWNKPPHK